MISEEKSGQTFLGMNLSHVSHVTRQKPYPHGKTSTKAKYEAVKQNMKTWNNEEL